MESIEKNKDLSIEAAFQDLQELGYQLAEKINDLRSISTTQVTLSYLFTQKDSFQPEEIRNELDKIILMLTGFIDENDDITEDEKRILKAIINSLSMVPTFNCTLKDASLIIDSVIIDILNNPQISHKSKNEFMSKLSAHLEEVSIKATIESVDDKYHIGSPLPCNFFYAYDAHKSEEKLTELRKIKRSLKALSEEQKSILQSETGTDMTIKYGDELVLEEIEDYEREISVTEANNDYTESSAPSKNSSSTLELITILRKDKSSVTRRELALARIQLIRIYREYLNTILAGNITSNYIANRQFPKLDLNDIESWNKEMSPASLARRVALFDMMHVGTVDSHQLNFNLDRRNQLPVSQELIDTWLAPEQFDTKESSQDIRLNNEEEQMVNRMKPLLKKKIAQNKSKVASEDVDLLEIEGLPELIARKVLNILNLDVNGYSTKIKSKGVGLSVNSKDRIFSVPQGYCKGIGRTMLSIAHEIEHIAQKLSRDLSLLPGHEKLSPLEGRARILGEAGAIKVEMEMSTLIGEEREVNIYHFDILRLIAEGKNYWEIFEEIAKILQKRNNDNNEGRSEEEIVKTTLKVINRAYGNLGDMSQQSRLGRYPTAAEFLSYSYPALNSYSELPSHISGLPAHRKELFELLQQPLVNGLELTDERIIKAVIRATYEVLLENNLLEDNEA